ncbi:L-aspartate oxidase [Allosalinactinospora lopnorensis]|uniref:L-aspartate oxidase n=1 Tax=Allosalinactinospora lopnorensis TaxID=1352348 RepID=UPI000623F4ED|nr:L-aspartate oxidase [Allosalinactinospora lopnorensis]
MSETPVALPLRQTAPRAGWRIETDVVVVGSGIAGLSTALRYTRRNPSGRVVVVTKDVVSNSSTRWAQGGIAAAVDPVDAPIAHMVDTMAAGAGACDAEAVRTLVNEGPEALRWLVELGTAFDRADNGELALTREGGHRANRIAHAGGDATGAEIQRALVSAVRAEPRIEVIEHAFVPDLLFGVDSEHPLREAPPSIVCGVTVHVMGEGQCDGVGAVRALAVVLATGGMGQVFAATTNPAVSTGDGLALALRAGAAVQDLEFVQFHPTVLWLGPEARGQQPLISEALRGEGAFLVDTAGRRFMSGEHELADLAPRNVVAKAIAQAMTETGASHVYLDARHFGAEKWQRRFPTILASCTEHGIDPVRDLVPVVPAAHYASGGVAVDLHGRTDVRGLYAVGEVARTGVHGANRLASNSLLEGVVFADRIAGTLAAEPPARCGPAEPGGESGLVDPAIVPELRAIMSRYAGVRRDGRGLSAAAARLAEFAERSGASVEPGVPAWEATNLLTVATALVHAAARREETRGSHWRADHPRTAAGPYEYVCLDLRSGRLAGYSGRRGADPRSSPVFAELRDEIGGPVWRTVLEALHEDLGSGAGGDPLPCGTGTDITSAATIPDTQIRAADVVARAGGVVAGLPVAEFVFWSVTEGIVELRRRVADGDEVERGDVLMTVTARTRDLLTAERTALNFLTHLSGIATATRSWVDAVAGSGARIRDTRKTHPGLRTLEKYAVRCGGGVNHRYGLSDAVLVKDNHVLAAGGVAEAVRAVRDAFPGVPLEVEVDRIDQIEPALKAGAEEILLDNFTVAELREAVALVAGRARLEASGGLALPTASQVAATGVDYLAVGALTHSSPALDIALDLHDSD